ncbi:MAG: hypothetical protein JWM82_1508, partial [Myxococcales bacterium]|nr:hypothetical protein [Myxococcales bacterium]
KPTADDIDRALSVLTEIDDPGEGTAAPAPPLDFAARDTAARQAVDEPPPVRVRKSTDAQPIVLESSADVGDAPSRRTGTRPLFSGAELRGKTVPVIPIGGPEDDEEDATTAWAGSGPTRTDDGPDLSPDDEASPPSVKPSTASPPALVAPPAPTRPAVLPVSSPAAAQAPATAHDLPAASEAPKIMAASFTSTPPKKPRSNAPFVLLGLLVVAGGGFFVLKAMNLIPSTKTATKTSTTTPAPEPGAATTAAVPAGEATLPPNVETTDALAAAAPTGEAKPGEGKPGEATAPEKVGEAKPTPSPPVAETATPATLRARPLGPPEEPPKPTPAAPATKETAKDTGSSHHTHHRSAAATEGATPAVEGAAASGDGAPAKSGAVPPPDVLKITTTPGGAEVIIDGLSVGTTPYSANDLDPATPHSITLKKDGFEAHDRMISSSDWQHAKGGAHALKITVKLRSTGHAAPAEGSAPAKEQSPADPAPGLGTTPSSPKRE